jgi:hypothetical protein
MQIAAMNQTINVRYSHTRILLITAERKPSLSNIKWNLDEANPGPVLSSGIRRTENSFIVQH